MEYVMAAYTDTGIQKESNQDSLCVRRADVPGVGEIAMAVLCDGMGGLQKGEVASAACVTAFGRWFDERLGQFPQLCGSDFSIIRRQWGELLSNVHRRLLEYAIGTKTPLGTTAAAIFLYGNRYLTVNIGDSRVYERKRELVQLTQDQSLVAREMAEGRITEEESRHHPQRNILLQCLGAGGSIAPVFTEGRVPHDALYLLCSDGLVHEVSRWELGDRLDPLALRSKEDLTGALSSLVELCKGRGETDNITGVLIRTQESGYAPKEGGFAKLKESIRVLRGKKTEAPETRLLEKADVIHTGEMIL